MNRPKLTLTEAARASGRSKSTLRRAREAGKFPHAEQDSEGVWRVPVGDLLTAGFNLTRQGRDPAEQGDSRHEQAGDRAMTRNVDTYEPTMTMSVSGVIELRERLARAEATAQALERTVRGLETALRAIEGKPAGNNLVVAADVVDVRTPATGERKAHWWRRTTNVD